MNEAFTSARCYWCCWHKGDWFKNWDLDSTESDQGSSSSSQDYPYLHDPATIPPGLTPRGISRFKHDNRSCTFKHREDRLDDHPHHIYRDGGAAVNILHLSDLQYVLADRGAFPKAEIHQKKHQPPCFRSKSR